MGNTPAPTQGPTYRLARYVVESKATDIPSEVTHEAKRALLNWLGCAIGGCRHAAVETALSALARFSGPPEATLLGRRERLDILHAALMNGISSHVLDFDDTHHPTLIHPSSPIISAALALSEAQRSSGEALLHAIVLGIDVACRIGRSVFPSHYEAGWHITGTAGVFGAAAASGCLLKLTQQQMAWALGIAATQASGLREMFGTMCKSFHPGRAAQNGLTSALLARAGFSSSERALEAPRGFAHVLSSNRDWSLALDGLGERFELMSNMYKPFACGLVVHPVIDGCLELRARHGPKVSDIKCIRLRVHPLVVELTGKKQPKTGLEGKFSVYHSAAVAIIQGAAGEEQYSDKATNDPEVVALRDAVDVVSAGDVAETQATIAIELSDGRILTHEVAHATGTLQKPMTDRQIEEKVRGLVRGVLDDSAGQALIRLCWSSDTIEDAGALASASMPSRDDAAWSKATSL